MSTKKDKETLTALIENEIDKRREAEKPKRGRGRPKGSPNKKGKKRPKGLGKKPDRKKPKTLQIPDNRLQQMTAEEKRIYYINKAHKSPRLFEAMSKLSMREQELVKEYLKCGCKSEAARNIGMNISTAKGKLINNKKVMEAVDAMQEEIDRVAHRDIATIAEIQEIRSQILRGNVKDDMGFSPEMSVRLTAGKDLEKHLKESEEKALRLAEEAKIKLAQKWTIPPSDLTKDFIELYRDIHDAFNKELDMREAVLKGGRGSIKSSFISELAYETIRQDAQAHVVYTRRYKVDLRGSVYNQFMKTVIHYNDLDNWEFKQSPLMAKYKPTGQCVMFVGADKPISLKSFNLPFGYVKLLIHEECDEMAGLEQMDNIEDTFLRSDTVAIDIKVFNPPKSKNNFMNNYVEVECKKKPTTRVYHSYFYNVPVKWLGQRFFDRAKWFKEHKNLYYRNNYLGEVTGTGGGIFDNVEVRPITDDEIASFPVIYNGLDFGFEHPQTFVRCSYDETSDTLYCFYEQYSKHTKNLTFARKIKQFINKEIIADSARPDAIAEMQEWGFNIVGAKKRWSANKGRDYCWEWLQQTTKIIVDDARCPHLAHELTTLEHEQLPDGTFSDAYPKLEEDCVMALIYSLNRVIMNSRRNDGLYDDFSEFDEDYEEEIENPYGNGEE